MSLFPKQKQLIGLVVWLVLTFAASSIGAIASIQAKSFYSKLLQPSWAPPGWVFGPVWSILYTMMGIAAWLVWRSGGIKKNQTALGLFIVQLTFNALWSWLFFAWSLGGIAFGEIIMLWALILATLISFWKKSILAGALLVPYLLWVSFATALNYSLWQLNPELLN